MKPISESAKRKAVKLANDMCSVEYWTLDHAEAHTSIIAFARHLDEVSEVAGAVATKLCSLGNDYRAVAAVNILQPLILPDEPDGLAEALKAEMANLPNAEAFAVNIRHQLAKRGLKIVKADQ